MNRLSKIDSKLDINKSRYIQYYQKIRSRCQFQKNFSGFLLIVFFLLQYSVPIFLVVLGSIASSREQLAIFFSSGDSSSESSKTSAASEAIVSRIIYLVGLITILLGVINNIVRPAESYDTAAKYNNTFSRFDQNFALEFLAISSFSDEVDDRTIGKIIINFLIAKNDELCQLIEEYNDARSLSPRLSLQQNNKNDSQHPDSPLSIKPDDQGFSNLLKSSSLRPELDAVQQADQPAAAEHTGQIDQMRSTDT